MTGDFRCGVRALTLREYSATISSNVTVGVFLLELVVNGVPAAESPLIYQVVEVTCEDNQVARLGECVEVTNKSNTFLIILAVVLAQQLTFKYDRSFVVLSLLC